MATPLRREEQFGFPIQVALGYAAISVAWIIAWDRIIAAAPNDELVLVTVRRIIYVGAMAVFLWWLARREVRRTAGLKARFDAIAEQSVVGVFITRDNRLLYVNDSLPQMLGSSRAEMMARPATDFVDPVEVERAKVHGWGFSKVPYRRVLARRADGTTMPVHVARRRVELEDGPAFAGVVLDASLIEALEGQLRRGPAQSSLSATLRATEAAAVANLRAAEAAAASAATGPGIRAAGWRTGHTVLVVDDEPAVRRVIAAALRRQGYKVVEASESRTALEQFDADAAGVDLVICDFLLPGGNGLELVQRLRQKRPDLKVLFVTGFSRRELEAQQPDLARFPFIEKPFSVEELTRSVDRMWEAASA